MLNLMMRSLFRRKVRTLLTAIGITIGVTAIVALGAMAEGLRTGYMAMFSGSGADLVLMQRGAYDVTLSAIDEKTIEQIAAEPNVSAVTGMLVANTTASNLPHFYLFGYDPASFAIKRFKIVEGAGLDAVHRAAAANREVLLGKTASEQFKATVGGVLRLGGSAFRVAGIFETGNGFEDGGVVVSISDAQKLLQKSRQVSAIQVKLQDTQQVDQVRARLERAFPRLIVSQSSQVANQQQIIDVLRGVALGISLLAIIIGGVVMTNTAMMGVFERVHEIGTLRALGWSRRRVLLMVLGESMLLGAAGGAMGCLISAVLVGVAGQSITTSYLRGSLTLPLLAQGMLTAIILGTVGGIYPAGWAAHLLPIEAMRYEGGVSLNSRITNIRFEVLRTLLRRRTRTILAVIGVSMSLAAVAALGGLMEAAITEFNERFSAGNMDLVVRQQDVTDMAFSTIDERVGRQMAALPGVQSIAGSITGIQTSQEIPYLIVMGYAPHESLMLHFRIVEGRGLSGNREMIIGRLAADAIKVHVGSVVRLGEVAFRVVGLFETGMSWEESIGVIALRDAQALYGKPHQVTFYSIKLTDPQQADRVIQSIHAQFPDLLVARSSEFTESLPDFQSMSGMMLAVSLLAIVVGGIGLLNTMIMTVFERTREIGTLRALGWRRRKVLINVIKESLVISLAGAVIGLLLAAAFSLLLQQIPMFGSILAITFSPGLLLRTVIVAVCLGVVGGLYPAWRASNLSPVEALRYE